MTEQVTEQHAGETAAMPSPGRLVREAREARGESVQEVADALHMLPRMVRALEAEDWKALQSPAFVRGYYRAYAKWLELEPAMVVQAYNQVIGDDQPPQPQLRPANNAEIAKRLRTGLSPWHLGGVVVAVILILAWWFWPAAPEAEAPVVESPAPEAAAPAGAPAATATGTLAQQQTEPSPALVDRARPTRTVPGLPEAQASSPSTVVPETAPATALAPAATPAPASPLADAPVVVTPPGAQRVTPTGTDEVRLSFTDECWVELRDPAGARLYSDLHRAGDDLVLVGDGPFRLLLGNASAAEVSFNGNRVSISRGGAGNVATVTLEP
jgi:cytoskeleton protein RodZ